jgi:nucleoid-associated protein YgaU
LQNLANKHGEQLVPVEMDHGPGSDRSAPALPAGIREYKAEAGDSLSRIAARLLGANTKTNRQAIIKLNASLQQDPDKVVVGQKYLVPAAAEAPPATAAPQPVAEPARSPKQAAPAQARPAAPPTGGAWYTVKENDKLWKIAAEQLGTGNRWKEIQDLNPDVLQGSANVRPGMRLRLPPKATN